MTDASLREIFERADLADDRFVRVEDGQKKSIDHDTRYSDPLDVPGQNFGIYADRDDQLLALDVDVHRNESETDEERKLIVALNKLGLTLRVRSPHAEPGIGGHRILKLAGAETPAELFERVFGRMNPVPSWGEVISKNKYIVGPGSQLDSCSKEWCERCKQPDEGHYELEERRDIATVEPADLVDALAADPDLSRTDSADNSELDSFDGQDAELSREDVKELLGAIPGNQHFDDWIRTGYAVYSWDSEEVGKEVFKEWSESNTDWEDEESQRQINYIWNSGDEDGERNGNAGIGTLVHQAREHGYDGELSVGQKQPDELSASSWSNVRTVYDTAQKDQEYPKGYGRKAGADKLEAETSWMYVLESERLWVYDSETGRYDRYGKSYAASRLEEGLDQHYSSAERREVISRLEARNQVHRDVLNARQRDDPLVCVANGVVNLRTGETAEHGPEYRFVRGLDVEHDTGTADPEPVLTFLDEITERVADRDTLLDHLAHGLMPGHPYRAFVVCYGPGGNGKTQAAELFRGFVGRQNAAAVEIDELADGDFATGDLPGKFINWGDDMAGDGGGQLSDLSILKKATGGSEIRANEKYEKTFNFKNEASMFFSANEPPRIGEQKASIQDRIYPIHMPYKFRSNPDPEEPLEKQKTPKASEVLLEDSSAMKGMLQLAVEHAQELIENRGQYSQPETPAERLDKYNRSADPIVMFGGSLLEGASAEHRIRKDDTYRTYQSFTDAEEERSASERGFKRQLSGAVPFEIEEAQSRALATGDEDGERVRCWKRLKWTETAKQHMPEWLIERYADHFETGVAESAEDADPETAAAGSTQGVKALEPGRHDVEVQLLEKLSPPPYLEGEGTVIDEAGDKIGYVCRGDFSLLTDADEGDTLLLKDAKVTTDRDGVVQLELGWKSSELHVQPSVDADQTSVEASTDGGDPPDRSQGSAEQLKKRVKDELRNAYGPRGKCSVAAVAGALDAEPAAVETVLDHLAHREGLLEKTEDGYSRLS